MNIRHQGRPARLLLSVLALMLSASAIAAGDGVIGRPGAGPAEISADRVAPRLLRGLERGGRRDFVIEFRERADLSAAFDMEWNARGRYVHRVLRETAERSQAAVRAALTAAGADVESYWIKNAMLVRQGDLAALETVARFSQVRRIIEPPNVSLIEPEERRPATHRAALVDSLAWVGADQVWARGTNGSGVTVGVIDTGVRYTHEAIVGQYRGNLGDGTFSHDYNWRGSLVEPNTPYQNTHATHVLGTIVGDNRAADPAARERTGMAPGAKWIACFGIGLDTTDFELLDCGQFMLAPTRSDGSDPDPDLRAHVVNNSWMTNCDAASTDFYSDIVEAWVAAGIFPVFAAGNTSNCDLPAPPGLATVANPGALGGAFTIGSTGNHDGQYAPHSLWGPAPEPAPDAPGYPDANGYPYLKPQVVAPGVDIRSAVIDDDQSYGALTGTSMSAPHITGLVALMLDAAECLSGDYATLAEIIMETARPVPYDSGGEPPPGPGNVPNYATGWGEIDAPAAVDAAAALCGPSGSLRGIVSDKSGQPVAGARVEIFVDESERVYETVTEADGGFVRRLPVDSGEGYTVRVSAYGYLAASETGVLVFEDQMTAVDPVLAAAPVHHIGGRVSDALTGWPLYAKITVSGAPQGVLWSDPSTGAWAVDLPEGMTFRFDVNSEIAGYLPQTLTFDSITGGATVDFELEADAGTCTAPGYEFTGSVLSEDFSGAAGGTPPAGWQTESNGLGWQFGDAGELSSSSFTVPDHGQFAAANDELGAGGGWDNDGRFDYLVLPSQDLTALDNPVLTFRSYHEGPPPGLPGQTPPKPATVEASTDGGATWVVLGTPQATNFEAGWTEEAVSLAPVIGNDVLIRFHADDLGDGGIFGSLGPGWAVDDVAIRTGCAAPAQGGLVLGQTRDANTQAALSPAEVRIDDGEPVHTGANEELGPGFFALYAGPSASLLRAVPGAALPGGYGEYEGPVFVADGETVRQDALLPAGRLRIYPESPSATLDLGTTATATFTVANAGTSPLNFGFEGEAVEEHFEAGFPPSGWTLETAGTDCAWQWLDPATHPNLAGGDGRAIMVNPIDCFDASGTDTALITHELDLSGSSTASMGFFLAFHEPGIGQTRLDIDATTDGGANWETVFTETEVNSAAGPGTLIEFDLTPYAGSSALQVRFRFRSDTNWSRVVIDQVHLFGTINNHETLTLLPDAGNLQPGESVEIQTTFDATMVAQPGVFRLPIRIAEDTPYPFFYGDFAATMTVTAPASYGALSGYVHGLGKCDAGAVPLSGVEISITGGGDSFIAHTDALGGYEYWLEAGQGPFTVTVAADDYLTETRVIELQAGQSTAADFDLRLLAPCLESEPAAITAEVAPGEVETALMELINSGPAATDWQIRPGGDPGVLTPSAISQTNSSELEEFVSFACIDPGTGFVVENRYLRVFPMSEYGPGGALDIQGITFGVDNSESVSGSQPVHVRLYALEGEFVFANLTLLAETTVEVADTVLEHISAEFDSPVSTPADAVLVAEIHVPDGVEAGNKFYPGGNSQGASASSWSVAPACGWEEPLAYEELNFGWMHLVLELDVLVSDPCGSAAAPVPWLSLEPAAGELAGDASRPFTATLDAGGREPGIYQGTACMAEQGDDPQWTVIPAWMHVGDGGGNVIFSDRFE